MCQQSEIVGEITGSRAKPKGPYGITPRWANTGRTPETMLLVLYWQAIWIIFTFYAIYKLPDA